jgi:hypothetical protein
VEGAEAVVVLAEAAVEGEDSRPPQLALPLRPHVQQHRDPARLQRDPARLQRGRALPQPGLVRPRQALVPARQLLGPEHPQPALVRRRALAMLPEHGLRLAR